MFEKLESACPWTNVYGFARSLLATGTALTLLFNKSDIFFRPAAGLGSCPICLGITKIGIFCLADPHLELARWMCIIALAVVASGWRPRFTAFFHWWISFSLQTSAITLDGGDQVTAVLTLFLLPIALTDNRRWHWQSAPSNDRPIQSAVAVVSLAAIRLEVAIIYFDAAIAKAGVPEWMDGTVLYYWFIHPVFGLPNWMAPMRPLATTPFVAPVTWAVVLLEIALATALVMPKRAWKFLLVAGIAFHVAIGLTMGLITFGIAMCAALILYLRPFEREFSLAVLRREFIVPNVLVPQPVAHVNTPPQYQMTRPSSGK